MLYDTNVLNMTLLLPRHLVLNWLCIFVEDVNVYGMYKWPQMSGGCRQNNFIYFYFSS